MKRKQRDYLSATYVGMTLDERIMADCLNWNQERKKGGGLHEQSIVVVHDPQGGISGIGASCVDDLFTDNFGIFLAALIRSPNTGNTLAALTDTTDSSQPIYVYYGSINSIFNYNFQSPGTSIQVGSSTTAPARSDYKIGTAFVDAPESGLVGTDSGSYGAGSGNITFSTSITANVAESGTINEAGFFASWVNESGSPKNYMLAHDAISPGQGFTGGASITVGWSITD